MKGSEDRGNKEQDGGFSAGNHILREHEDVTIQELMHLSTKLEPRCTHQLLRRCSSRRKDVA